MSFNHVTKLLVEFEHLPRARKFPCNLLVSRKWVDGGFTTKRAWTVFDCGRLINPQNAQNQVEGGINEGMSAALHGEISVRDGMVEQSNFHDYPINRMADLPKIDVHFVESEDAPRGLGEGPLPPVAPAICNAIFAATGKRVRKLPIDRWMS